MLSLKPSILFLTGTGVSADCSLHSSCVKKVLMKPILYLSHFFKKNRQYYDRLQFVRAAGDWERWLIFFLRGIVEVSGQATETARNILTLREDHRLSITENLGRTARHMLRKPAAEPA